MHVDLCGIRDLLAVDVELDTLKAEAAGLAASVRDAKAALAAAEVALETAKETRGEAIKEERRLNRKLEDYTAKRDRTRELIDTQEP